ncbi:MAG: peptidoglycan DD-metalloendopeptidase family protein [Myxococcota bacterium]
MASSPLPGGSRHVGRVIDPSVREDGEPEPAVELEANRPSVDPEPPLEPPAPSALPRGGRAREVLLERAQSMRTTETASHDGSALAELDEIGRTESDEVDSAQPSVSGTRAPSAPHLAPVDGRLSPNMVAVFGTLLGVATVASLVALGMNLDLKQSGAPVASASIAPAMASAAPSEPTIVPKRQRTKQPGPWRIADARSDARMRVVEGKVGTDPFLKSLEKAGVETREIYRILTSMKGVRDFDRCKSSDRFTVLIERGSSKVKAFEYVTNPEDVYQSREGDDGLLKGSKLDLKVERRQISGALVHDGKSFDESAERGGFDRGLARVVSKALDGHMSLDEIDRGSRIRVIAQEVTVLGDFARYAGVEALEIQGNDGKPFRLYYVEAPGERGYYDSEGQAPYEGGWRKPIKDAPVTSPYNLKRLHPILKKVVPHLGIDFGAPMGTPIGAASSGTITNASYVGPTGNFVRIQHANGIETGYAHLSRFAEGLKVGDKVKRLQVIGYVGSTGRSTGPHLHFTARRNGEFFDPATLNFDAMRTLSKDARPMFNETKAKYDALLDGIQLPAPLAPEPASAVAAAPSAAPAASGAPPASEEAGDEEDETTSAAAPNAPAPAAPAAGAKPAPGSAVYLSDQELLKLQGASDEGEVAE